MSLATLDILMLSLKHLRIEYSTKLVTNIITIYYRRKNNLCDYITYSIRGKL